ncbi:MAG: aldo/keto reductase [Phycisphaera sp.]|nr:aldo/keto reductase [Phycisphaera sp.]
MKTRPLGKTGLQVPVVSFGASSLGQEFRQVDINEALRAVRVALDCGMSFIDTAAYYGRGMSEVMLGVALRDVPRDSYTLQTKLGRYAPQHFDFSAKRVVESIDISLERMGVDHLDCIICHDIEFVDMSQIINETLPAIRKEIDKGKVRFVGVSGYPMKIFKYVLDRAPLDVILSYNHYTLQNTMLADLVPYLNDKGVGIENAAPFSARLLTDAKLPPWHKATEAVREVAAKAATHCKKLGSDIAKLALQYSIANDDMATCITGSANPDRIAQWAEWAAEPIDEDLLAEVLEILKPIHDWFYVECLPENADAPINPLPMK